MSDGLLGDGWGDPKSMATMQLAAGLLSPGSFGQGLGKGLAGYQGTMVTAQEMQLRQQQIAQAIQDQKIKDIALAQQTRMFDLQTPFLEQAVARMRGQPINAVPSATPGAPVPTDGLGSPQSQPQQQSAAPQQGGSMFPGVPDDVAFSTIGTGGFSKIPEMIGKYNEPTELIKTMRAAGIDPNSPLGRQFIQGNLAKSNYIAPVNARPGAILRDPTTMQPLAFNPHVPEGGAPVFDASGNVTAISPIQNATAVMQAAEAARAAGKAQFTPFSGVDQSGQPLPVKSVTDVLGGTPPTLSTSGHVVSTQAALQGLRDALPMKIKERDEAPPGPIKDGLSREINRDQNALLSGKPWQTPDASPPKSGVYAAPPLGAVTGANNAQDTMTQSFRAVMGSNASSQTVQARLSNIQQLADSAITGGDTAYRDSANNLLSIAFPGDLSKQATDRKTAGDLIDKNAAQIALAIGAGSNGTDALRSLAAAANPGRHMTPQAITEAVAQLKGSAQIQQAKAALLTPLFSAGDPKAYVQAEQQFDKNADYRLFQLKNMTPEQGRAFLAKLPASEQADLRAKAAAMKQMGAF